MDTIIAVLCIAVSLLAVFSLRLPRRRGAIIFALSWLLAGKGADASLRNSPFSSTNEKKSPTPSRSLRNGFS